jgi:steroid delta-isomerase-like uncharacterized protein
MEASRLLVDLFAAYNAHDPSAAAALYAAEATHEDVALGHPKHGPTDIAAGLAYFLTRFPDAQWTLLGHVGGPSSSVGWYRLTGTLQADFGPIQAQGQPLDLRGVQVLTHDGGRITRTDDYWDMQTFQREMNDYDPSP